MQCWPLPFFCRCVCSLHSHLLHSKFCLDIIYFAEIENCKHCNKIIFKCVNYAMWSIFNKKVAEKWNLWVHKQFMDALFTRELVKNYDCKKKKKEKEKSANMDAKRGSKLHLVSFSRSHSENCWPRSLCVNKQEHEAILEPRKPKQQELLKLDDQRPHRHYDSNNKVNSTCACAFFHYGSRKLKNGINHRY